MGGIEAARSRVRRARRARVRVRVLARRVAVIDFTENGIEVSRWLVGGGRLGTGERVCSRGSVEVEELLLISVFRFSGWVDRFIEL